jgi:hypothetical protein
MGRKIAGDGWTGTSIAAKTWAGPPGPDHLDRAALERIVRDVDRPRLERPALVGRHLVSEYLDGTTPVQ